MTLDDDWRVVTADGRVSASWKPRRDCPEGPKVLTARQDDRLFLAFMA